MVVLRNIRFRRILVAIPRVLNVHVLVVHQSRHLQVSGNLDAFEGGIVEVLPYEGLLVEFDVGCLNDLDPPFAVEALPQIGPFVGLRIVCVAFVVGMRRDAVDLEYGRIGEPGLGCVFDAGFVCHVFLLSFITSL